MQIANHPCLLAEHEMASPTKPTWPGLWKAQQMCFVMCRIEMSRCYASDAVVWTMQKINKYRDFQKPLSEWTIAPKSTKTDEMRGKGISQEQTSGCAQCVSPRLPLQRRCSLVFKKHFFWLSNHSLWCVMDASLADCRHNSLETIRGQKAERQVRTNFRCLWNIRANNGKKEI